MRPDSGGDRVVGSRVQSLGSWRGKNPEICWTVLLYDGHMVGTISVVFNGTPEEAREFATKHRAEFPAALTNFGGAKEPPEGQVGLAMLSAKFGNSDEMMLAHDAFARLGWHVNDQYIRCWKNRFYPAPGLPVVFPPEWNKQDSRIF